MRLKSAPSGTTPRFLDVDERVERRSIQWLAGFFIFACVVVFFSESFSNFFRQYAFQGFLLVALLFQLFSGWRPLLGISLRSLRVLSILVVIYFGGLFLIERSLGWLGIQGVTHPWPQREDLVLLGVLAPILEEIFFRDMIFRSLVARLGKVWMAAVVSSLLFMVAHLTLYPGAFLLGLIGCTLVVMSKSLWPAIFFHAVSNFSLLFLPVWFPNVLEFLRRFSLFEYFYR